MGIKHLAAAATFCVAFTAYSSAQAVSIDVSQDGTYLGTIESYSGSTTASANYNYYSSRQHLGVGPTLSKDSGQFFFYEGSDGLSFNFIFGSVNSNTSNGKFYSDITVANNLSNAAVLVSDDAGEVTEPSADHFKTELDWIQSIGDGGSIGAFSGDAWSITVDPSDIKNVAALMAYSSNGSFINLQIDISKDIVFSYAVSSVPVPAAVWMMGSGLLGLLAWRRRQVA